MTRVIVKIYFYFLAFFNLLKINIKVKILKLTTLSDLILNNRKMFIDASEKIN